MDPQHHASHIYWASQPHPTMSPVGFPGNAPWKTQLKPGQCLHNPDPTRPAPVESSALTCHTRCTYTDISGLLYGLWAPQGPW